MDRRSPPTPPQEIALHRHRHPLHRPANHGPRCPHSAANVGTPSPRRREDILQESGIPSPGLQGCTHRSPQGVRHASVRPAGGGQAGTVSIGDSPRNVRPRCAKHRRPNRVHQG